MENPPAAILTWGPRPPVVTPVPGKHTVTLNAAGNVTELTVTRAMAVACLRSLLRTGVSLLPSLPNPHGSMDFRPGVFERFERVSRIHDFER